jgi:hypothetical protein
MAPPNPVDQFCQKTGVNRSDLSDAEIALLSSLSPDELNALAHIHTKGLALQPVARVGSSGF